jgi:glycosyltransferase involved in cell wall biosynthesis
MRVLHINAGNLYGGVETILVSLARYRDLCPEMEVAFALCFDARLSQELAEIGVDVHMLGNVRASRPLTVWRARRALAQLLRQKHFDLVVCHSAWPHAIFAPVVRAEKKPLVFWLHGGLKGSHWLERWAARTKPQLVLAVSRYVAETSQKTFPNVRSQVFYSPLLKPERVFTSADRVAVREEFFTAEDATVIIQVSRMEPGKGHLLHLKALSELRDLASWVCWQVGGAQRPQEEAYFEEVKHAAAGLGIADRIRFLGQRSDVPRLLAAADLFCQPNIETEGFSISFIEAFLARLPIVTTGIGGAMEIVDDSCGVLVPVADCTALTAALRPLILDAPLRERMGESGYGRVWERCDPADQMTRLNEIFAAVALTAAA